RAAIPPAGDDPPVRAREAARFRGGGAAAQSPPAILPRPGRRIRAGPADRRGRAVARAPGRRARQPAHRLPVEPGKRRHRGRTAARRRAAHLLVGPGLLDGGPTVGRKRPIQGELEPFRAHAALPCAGAYYRRIAWTPARRI